MKGPEKRLTGQHQKKSLKNYCCVKNLNLPNHKKLLYTLEKSNEIIGNNFVMLWVRDLNLKLSVRQLESIFELALENFYLQINDDNLNHQWLSNYFNNLKNIVKNFAFPN